MKILFLCHRQHDVTIGGVAEFIHFLPLALKKYGIEGIIYTQSEQPSNTLLGPTLLNNGIPLYTGPFLKPALFSFKKELKPLLQLCKQEKIDIIHAQGLYRSGYIAEQINRLTNIPYIITSHSDILPGNSERIKRDSVQRRCRKILKNAAAVTHLTEHMATASHAIFDTREKSTLIGNGIDLAAWQPVANEKEKNYLLAIGRLEREKGFSILIDAYAELQKQGIKTSLLIAGTGSLENELHDQVKKLGLNLITHFSSFDDIPEASVIFTGYIRGDIKKHLMAQSKIILFSPQWDEPFGIVQIEAMAAGKPMIASDNHATRYLQQLGLHSQLVPASNSHAWANAMLHLLNDEPLRKKMRETNLQNVQQFDWEKIAAQYADIFKKTLALPSMKLT